jgi:hypothetical protein
VTGIQLGELDLALGALAVGGAGGRPLACDRPFAQCRGPHGLGFQHIDPPQQARQKTRRVAADLVAAQGKLVEPIEEDREPVGRSDGGEERVEARLHGKVAKQRLGDLSPGSDPQFLVGPLDHLLGALTQPRPPRARPAQDQDVLWTLATFDERTEAADEGLGAP